MVWVDESGFYLLPALVKTWAPRGAARRGQLPTLPVPLTRDHLSVISAVTEDLRRLSRTWNDAINGKRVVAFLQHILRQVPGKVLVVWDGAAIHRCNEVKRFLTAGSAARLKLLVLPGYAPDLNPAEGVWRWLKRVALGNVCCMTLEALRDELRLALARLRHRKDVLQACISRPGYIH
jgi:transposase